jgi:hypothetical protein
LRAVTQLGVDYAQGNRLHQPEHIDTYVFVERGGQLPVEARV